MKLYPYFFILLFVPLSIYSSDPCDILAHVFRVKFPPTIQAKQSLCAYYKGRKLEFDNDMCIISHKCPINNLFIIITEQIANKLARNNTRYLERLEHQRCRLFYITRTYDPKTHEPSGWLVEEESSCKIPTRIHEKALILLMNPKFVKTIAYNPSDSSFKDSKDVIILPQVIIDPKVTEQEFNKASVYTLLASLDANALHSQDKKTMRHERSCVIRR